MKAVRTIALLAPLTLAGCALVLCGCKTVGPNYKAPPVPAPPSFSDDGHNGDWASATPADAADRGTWWAIYQDPGLNTLEQRCASANQNIAASLHAYQQAHDLVRQTPRIALPHGLHRRLGHAQPSLGEYSRAEPNCLARLLGVPHPPEHLLGA